MEQAKGRGLWLKWACKAAAHIQVGAVRDNRGGAGVLMQGVAIHRSEKYGTRRREPGWSGLGWGGTLDVEV